MQLRKLSDIKLDEDACKAELEKLYEERQAIVKACPHPLEFIHTKITTQDEPWKHVRYTCALCEGTWADRYDEKAKRPTLNDLLSRIPF